MDGQAAEGILDFTVKSNSPASHVPLQNQPLYQLLEHPSQEVIPEFTDMYMKGVQEENSKSASAAEKEQVDDGNVLMSFGDTKATGDPDKRRFKRVWKADSRSESVGKRTEQVF